LRAMWKDSNSIFFFLSLHLWEVFHPYLSAFHNLLGICLPKFINNVEFKCIEWYVNNMINHDLNGWLVKLTNHIWFFMENHDSKQFMSMDEINIDGWIYPLWLNEFHVWIMSNEIKRIFLWMGNDPTRWNFF
jgi:hypothetical protein